MKRIVLFDPSQGTLNAGDFIIRECLEEEMKYLFENQLIVRYGTHTPISRFYQTFKKNIIYKTCNTADFKFLCGTSLFKASLLRISPDWNINHTSCEYYRNSVAIGCGMDMNASRIDSYTKAVYRKILSKEYIHSTRDARTKSFFESLGFQAVNTGCPTLWAFTKEKCDQINTQKSDSVVFTLTDYSRDLRNDMLLINILKQNYKKIYFWVQGFDDYDYLRSLTNTNEIEIIPHSIEAYASFLSNTKVDYVGTRLHAGIYAMRHGIRSIIISIDNRTLDMRETYNLHTVNRESLSSELPSKINSEFRTSLKIPFESINMWKEQFR